MRSSAGWILLTVLFVLPHRAHGQCEPHWVHGVGDPGVNGHVFALCSFDDGSGPALYAGGVFTMAGDVVTRGIARWNGSTWSGVGGSGIDFSGIFAMTVWDDGNGPALYAAGYFNHISGVAALAIAKWNGTTWSKLGSGINGTVSCLIGHDDGSGPSLFAGGHFSVAGGVSASNVAKWNGTSWSNLSSGCDDRIYSAAIHDDGSGTALYFAGHVTNAGGESVMHVTKWDGANWSAVGEVGGLMGAGKGDHLHTLRVFNDNGIPRLHGGGFFLEADGNIVRNCTRWNGTEWLPMGPGFNDEPKASEVFDDRTGGGPQLISIGQFNASGITPMNYVAKWTGTSWAALGPGLNGAGQAGAVHDFGTGEGPALYIGGYFSAAAGHTANHVAQWNGAGHPTIVAQPDDAQVAAGTPVVFSVEAIGNPTLTYQWRRNGENLVDGGAVAGATTNALTISPATAGLAGSYDVVITNPCDDATSQIALLTVLPACPGDTFEDSFVDGLDVHEFVECVLTGQGCAGSDLDVDLLTADLDTEDDMAGFVVRLMEADTACP